MSDNFNFSAYVNSGRLHTESSKDSSLLTESHQTLDTHVEPKGIEELVKEVLVSKLPEIQMGFEHNPKSVKGSGKKGRPQPIAFPYVELKTKFPEHFRRVSSGGEDFIRVSRDFIDAIDGLKVAGGRVRSHQLPTLQDLMRDVNPNIKRVLKKGVQGQKATKEEFMANVKVQNGDKTEIVPTKVEMYMYPVDWDIIRFDKATGILWLTPTPHMLEEGITDFGIDEKYLD